MKVRELIEALKALPEDAEIYGFDADDQEWSPVSGINRPAVVEGYQPNRRRHYWDTHRNAPRPGAEKATLICALTLED